MAKDQKVRAVALLSGGLDSILALRIILEQGVEVTALHMTTPFCTCNGSKGCSSFQIARRLNVPIRVIPVKQDYMEMLQNPRFGRGGNLNPCLDCRIYLFEVAKRLLVELGADFIFTGEVLGERPMSQRKVGLRLIEQVSGLTGKVVRPLSAKFFPPTKPEQEGLLDRSKFLRISGRSRAPQMKLAAELGEKDYPCPAGGCLLTDPLYCIKVVDALEHGETALCDMYLLRYGKHYRLPDGSRLAVGRNELENHALKGLARRGDIILELPPGLPGPAGVLRRMQSEATIHLAAQIVAALSDLSQQESVPVVYYWSEERDTINHLAVRALSDHQVTGLRIIKNTGVKYAYSAS